MKHFLLIDDDETFTRILARALTRAGHGALVANDAPTALTLLRDDPRGAAIGNVVLDLRLAESNGLQLLPQLLAIRPGLRVVVLTGYASVATTVDAIKRGAVNYLAKPATVDEVIAAFDDDPATAAADEPQQSVEDSPLSVQRMEWEYIQRQLVANNHNIAATARALGMHRRTLQRKLQKRPVKS